MADQIFQTALGSIRYKDMGDGTFALVQSTVAQGFVAATADAGSSLNVPLQSEALLNSNQPGASGATIIDRARANLAVVLVASGASAATFTSADQLNVNGHALDVILDVTVAGIASLTVAINAKDVASGKYYNLLTGVAVITNSTNVYRIGPALAAAANAVANAWVPRLFQVVVTQAGGPATYSLGYNLGE